MMFLLYFYEPLCLDQLAWSSCRKSWNKQARNWSKLAGYWKTTDDHLNMIHKSFCQERKTIERKRERESQRDVQENKKRSMFTQKLDNYPQSNLKSWKISQRNFIKARNWLVICSSRLENNMQQNLKVFFKKMWIVLTGFLQENEVFVVHKWNRRKSKNKLSLDSLNFCLPFGIFCETFSLKHLYLKTTTCEALNFFIKSALRNLTQLLR